MDVPTVQPGNPNQEDGMDPTSAINEALGQENGPNSPEIPEIGSRYFKASKHKATRIASMAKIMSELKEETGFHSYKAYMADLARDPDYREPSWNDAPWPQKEQPCAVINVFMEEDSLPRVSLRGHSFSAVQTFRSLRKPPKGTVVQIVLWHFHQYPPKLLDLNLVNVLGLGLKLEPCFFESLYNTPPSDIEDFGRQIDPTSPKYFLGAGTVVAVARDCLLVPKPESPPIILIAGPHDFNQLINQGTLDWLIPRVTRRSPKKPTDHQSKHQSASKCNAQLYTQLLTHWVESHLENDSSLNILLFTSLLPLLRIDFVRTHERCQKIRRMFGEYKYRKLKTITSVFSEDYLPGPWDRVPESEEEELDPMILYQYRALLRSMLEKFQDVVEDLARFLSPHNSTELDTSAPYSMLLKERSSLVDGGLRLEAEIRDYLQLNTGQLSLLESRRSIEVSNSQLEESKRGECLLNIESKVKTNELQSKYVRSTETAKPEKLTDISVTILAFVYIPLNLATSVFGMNLQQLNESGKNLNVFVYTAIAALVITGACWWVLEQINIFRSWRKRNSSDHGRPSRKTMQGSSSPKYSIAVRVWMLAWLMIHGHWSWMINSGAGWCVLINSQKRYQRNPEYQFLIDSTGDELIAGDFLSKFIHQSPSLGEDYRFHRSSGGWKGGHPPSSSEKDSV